MLKYIEEKYDDKQRLIYSKADNGLEEWREYDDDDNLIHYKDSNGFEEWYTYENGKEVLYKNTDGDEWNFDENGKFIDNLHAVS